MDEKDKEIARLKMLVQNQGCELWSSELALEDARQANFAKDQEIKALLSQRDDKQEVHDLDGLRRAAEFNRSLGFTGEIVLHPSNVAIVNAVYSASAEELEYYRGMVSAFAEAEAVGEGAVMYRGEHIDIAHVETAKRFLAQWDV